MPVENPERENGTNHTEPKEGQVTTAALAVVVHVVKLFRRYIDYRLLAYWGIRGSKAGGISGIRRVRYGW